MAVVAAAAAAAVAAAAALQAIAYAAVAAESRRAGASTSGGLPWCVVTGESHTATVRADPLSHNICDFQWQVTADESVPGASVPRRDVGVVKEWGHGAGQRWGAGAAVELPERPQAGGWHGDMCQDSSCSGCAEAALRPRRKAGVVLWLLFCLLLFISCVICWDLVDPSC